MKSESHRSVFLLVCNSLIISILQRSVFFRKIHLTLLYYFSLFRLLCQGPEEDLRAGSGKVRILRPGRVGSRRQPRGLINTEILRFDDKADPEHIGKPVIIQQAFAEPIIILQEKILVFVVIEFIA